ncbi:hypothetical protein Sp245p_31295 (plasmid) [Azospirillum baldaniorum]|nr:hypothetical protein Sp245p_31295 [Azospirillum baldaniorum]
MFSSAVHSCTCPRCRADEPHPIRCCTSRSTCLERRSKPCLYGLKPLILLGLIQVLIDTLISRLDEQQRRWFVAVEARRVGWGGVSADWILVHPHSRHCWRNALGICDGAALVGLKRA